MSTPLVPLLLFLLLLLGLAPPVTGTLIPPPSSGLRSETGYDRALREAMSRAQGELQRGITLRTDHSRWEDPWVVTTQHYRVTTIDSYFLGRSIADGLETMLHSFQAVLGTDWTPSTPLAVNLFPDLLAYNQFGDDFGDLRTSISGSHYAIGHAEQPVVAMPGTNVTQTQMWITHAAAQQFAHHAFRTVPPTWISEGIGAYFSLYWSPGYGPAELRRLVETGNYIPLSALIGAGIDSYAGSAHDRFMELGTFFWYLLHYREETRTAAPGEVEVPESFASYLHAVLSGEGATDHPFYLYFLDNVVQIERDFKACEFGS
jgi:hypothetical protein